MYEKDKILNSFPPDLAKDVRRVLDMLVMKNDDISSRYYIVNLEYSNSRTGIYERTDTVQYDSNTKKYS